MTIASNVNQCIATLKGIEAQLSSLAMNAQVDEVQKVFHETMLVIHEIQRDMNKRKTELELEEPQYKPS
ncbi:DUF1657 domain-containing protein [Cytobacillus sp. Hz8]|uniref:DUF1657 domain-containing protein n=1 Tax=Cytobacillus sp. Hz8 TaxID=3347168 RepID=UPI0035DF0224